MKDIVKLINMLDLAEGKFQCFHCLIDIIKDQIDCL
jgi:hypothetical protein